jgi:hypothetical protein
MAECQMLLTGFFAEFVGIAVLNLQNACYSVPCYGSPPVQWIIMSIFGICQKRCISILAFSIY